MKIRTAHALRVALAMFATTATTACVSDDPETDNDEHQHQPSVATDESGVSRVASTLRDANGRNVASVTFIRVSGGTAVSVTAQIAGADGIRGFHVHANDNPANGDGCIADPAQPATTHFVSADGHFNPGGGTHGDHAGDMPALFFTANGNAVMSFLIDHFTPAQLRGRAVIIHAGADNYGNIPVGPAANQYTPNSAEATTLTQNTGNAGARVACGLIR